MTREQALKVDSLLVKIETFEACLDELSGLETFAEIYNAYGIDVGAECEKLVKGYLEKFLTELDAM